MTTQEVANRLVALCREGKIQQAGEELYAENIVSIETESSGIPSATGIKAVAEKGSLIASMIEMNHGGTISDPIVAGNNFAIGWSMDVTMRGRGRMMMEEICVYKVENGKIVREQFLS